MSTSLTGCSKNDQGAEESNLGSMEHMVCHIPKSGILKKCDHMHIPFWKTLGKPSKFGENLLSLQCKDRPIYPLPPLYLQTNFPMTITKDSMQKLNAK